MSRWVTALRLIGMGWYIGVCIVLGVLGGLWLDSKFNTKPVLAIVGLILGIIVAIYGTYRMVLTAIENEQNKGH